MKVLIVDDDREYCAELEGLLVDAGHDVVAAHDVMEGIDALAQPGNGIAVVVLELMLEKLTGWDFLLLAKMRGYHQGVIIVSRQEMGINLSEIHSIATNAGYPVIDVVPRSRVRMNLRERLTQLAMSGILTAERVAEQSEAS